MSSPLRNMRTARGLLRSILLAAADSEDMETCAREGNELLNFVRDLGAEIGPGREEAGPAAAPAELGDMALVAWVGPDEYDGSRGIKSGIVPVGLVPLVVKGEHEDRMRRGDLRAQLQNQSNRYDVPIYLARFTYAGLIEVLTPGN